MTRDVREVVRDEPLERDRILAAVAEGPLTVPELAASSTGAATRCSSG